MGWKFHDVSETWKGSSYWTDPLGTPRLSIALPQADIDYGAALRLLEYTLQQGVAVRFMDATTVRLDYTDRCSSETLPLAITTACVEALMVVRAAREEKIG